MRNKIVFILYIVIAIYPSVPFEKYFKKYGEYYFKNEKVDYYWFIAQAKQESRFDSTAVSPVGAKGLMQLIKTTFTMYEPDWNKVISPKYNIRAGIAYDKWLWNNWTAPRPFIDRVSFMLGSYNCGLGHLLSNQKLAKEKGLNPNLWKNMEKTLYHITGRKNSHETIQYVKRIKKYYKQYTHQSPSFNSSK